jgi:hypothetical protein
MGRALPARSASAVTAGIERLHGVEYPHSLGTF